MKIYTKTGDQGETGLLGGVRVSKSHLAIKVCGSLDELNSLLGLAASHLAKEETLNTERASDLAGIRDEITKFQIDLFDLGSCVAACLSDTKRTSKLEAGRVGELEQSIDGYETKLPQMTAFILPNGSTAGCQLHHARSICRKVERRLVELIESPTCGEPESELKREFDDELIYMNRLGDLLFVMARYVNQILEQPETNWLPET